MNGTTNRTVARRWTFMVIRVTILGAAALFAVGGNPSSTIRAGALASTTDQFSISVTPTVGLVDGQTVAVHVDAPSGKVIYQITAHLCLPGHVIDNTWDFGFVGNYCSKAAVGSGDVEPQVTFPTGASSGDLKLKVGTGSVSWVSDSYHPHDITCGQGEPCDLVVEVQVTGGQEFINAPLCFGTGCPPEPTASTRPPVTSAATPAGGAVSGGTSQGAGGVSATSSGTGTPGTNSTGQGRRVASSSSGRGDDGNTPASESATVVSGGAEGPSRGVRVFVAAIVGALCGARIVVVLARVRRSGTKLGVA